MGKDEKLFLKVNMTLARKIGLDAAFLFAFLAFVGKYRKKDDQGYFAVENKYIMEHLGWYPRRTQRARGKIIEVGLLQYKQGVNQNIKNKYRI